MYFNSIFIGVQLDDSITAAEATGCMHGSSQLINPFDQTWETRIIVGDDFVWQAHYGFGCNCMYGVVVADCVHVVANLPQCIRAWDFVLGSVDLKKKMQPGQKLKLES